MRKIAIIEDNQDVLESTKEILELADYNIVTASDGKSGIEMVKKEKPDLIFCDISMPDLDGYSVLRILKKNPATASIPFIFLSAKSEKTDMRRGMNLGADDYITKPFEESELLETIESRFNRQDQADNEEENEAFLNGSPKNSRRGLEELENLKKDRKIKIFRKKDTIFRYDDFANYLFYVLKGQVKSIITDVYSKEFIIDIYGEGDFLGYTSLIENGDYFQTAKAMTATEIVVIPRADFMEMYNNNLDVKEFFSNKIIKDLRKREERLLLLAYASVRERLASSLLELKEIKNFQNGTPSSFVISREDLACIVGTAKESLIRTLSELKMDGMIDTDGQKISILDDKALSHVANS